MLEKYNLQDNQWLKRMFSLREKWALVYGRNTFCADMVSTQRSECMNVVVKHYVNYKNNIIEVFHHFQRLIDDRREKESAEDFKNAQSSHVMIFPIEILKHACVVYTHKIFALFSEELRKAFESKIEGESQHETSMIYKVRPFHRANEHIVTYDSIEGSIFCSCRKFEFSGILCSHSLGILTFTNVVQMPDEYILERWTKHAKGGTSRVCDVGVVIVDEKIRKKQRYKELCNSFMRVAIKAGESEDSYTSALDCLLKMENNVDGMIGKADNVTIEAKDEDVAVDDETNESKIKGLKPKGRDTYHSCKRPKNALEHAISRKRKPKPKATKSGSQHVSSMQESKETTLINDDYWNVTYNAFDPQRTLWSVVEFMKAHLHGQQAWAHSFVLQILLLPSCLLYSALSRPDLSVSIGQNDF
ncbi:protein FAR-RED IMPAIRED RESPONSE 1-like [Salvia splendens]|uniref:protein FAR-RED IMPAIRED RESPONSE 1-like n=1 Tax=Salvia splendens TaxID=180675 RepID=UPI001C25F568|nr:protein FAR-RED IMPAIRED RESPONSE 1-like [Salvia splendens]